MHAKGVRRGVALLCAAAMLVCCAVLTACGSSEKQLTTLRLNEVTHSVFYAPQYVAMELGFFEEEGLKVELTNGGGADKVMTALLADQADVGLMGPEASIYVVNEGKEDAPKVIGQLTKRDGSFLVGRTQEENFDWSTLAGKTIIGGRQGGVPCMSLLSALRREGLAPGSNVTVDTSVQFNLMAGAFEGGQGDYVTLFEPTASQFEKEGKGYIVASVGSVSGEIPFTAYQTMSSTIAEKPELIQSFVNAIYKGQRWVHTHTAAEVAAVIAPQFPDTDVELLTTVTQRHMDIDAWVQTPLMEEQALNNLQDVMEQAGELTQRVTAAQLIDNTFAQQAKE